MDIERIQLECKAMIRYIKLLEKEEKELIIQNKILAREALTNGYYVDVILEQPQQTIPSKKRKRNVIKKKEQPNKDDINENTTT